MTDSVNNEIRADYCSYYDQRNLFCSYQITDTPAAPKKQKKKKTDPKAPVSVAMKKSPLVASLGPRWWPVVCPHVLFVVS